MIAQIVSSKNQSPISKVHHKRASSTTKVPVEFAVSGNETRQGHIDDQQHQLARQGSQMLACLGSLVHDYKYPLNIWVKLLLCCYNLAV